MRISHRHFVRGRITDGDSADVNGDALSECINLDINEGVGMAVLRPGLDDVDGLGELPTLSGYFPYGRLDWQSGTTTVQDNTMLFFRRRNVSGAWENYWSIYTNAPFLTAGGTASAITAAEWTVLENQQAFSACNATAFEGVVRIALGNATDYRIFMNLCESGSRAYPNGLTVASTTTATYGAGIADGGKVYKGWLYDAGKLYLSDLWSRVSIIARGQTSSDFYLESAKLEIAVVPRYDGDRAPQWSLGLYAVITKSPFIAALTGYRFESVEIQTNFSGATTWKFSKRISHLDVYVRLTERDGLPDWTDFRRLYSIPFNNALTGSVGTNVVAYSIDAGTVVRDEGRWSFDSDGRPMVVGGTDTEPDIYMDVGTGSPTAVGKFKLTTPDDTAVDANIAVKPTGFMQRRKRMYAWGINGDSGQTKIAISARDNIQQMQLDVWWKLYRISWEGSRAITSLVEYRDRMLILDQHNAFYVDLEQRLDDQAMGLDTHAGLGTTLTRTIVRTDEWVSWANSDGVWIFDGFQIRNLLAQDREGTGGTWLEEWRRIDEQYKAIAFAGYNKGREEYWLAVPTHEIDEVPVYSVYVYAVKQNARNWRVYRFFWTRETDTTDEYIGFVPTFFHLDLDDNYTMLGIDGSSNVHVYALAERGTDDAGTQIDYTVSSQWLGSRSDALIPYTADFIRVHTAAGVGEPEYDTIAMKLYADRLGAPYHTVQWPTTRKDAARISARRMREFKWSIEGSFKKRLDAQGNVRTDIIPELLELSFDATQHQKRSR